MGLLDALFGQVVNSIQNHASPNTPGPTYDPNELINTIGGIFGQHAQQSGQDFSGQGNYGGYNNQPAGNQNSGIASSDQDPFGDPGQSNQAPSNRAFGNIASSDEDPYGDPGAR